MRLMLRNVRHHFKATVQHVRAGLLVALLTAVASVAQAQSDTVRRVLTPTSSDTVTTPAFDSLVKAGRTFTGIIADRYPNGRLRLLRSVVEGRPTGLWTEWFATGVVRYLAEWHPEGQGDGAWFYFHESGVVRDRTTYRRDIAEGASEGWHADGTKAFEGRFMRGRREGLWRFWGTDGRIDREVSFAADSARTLAATWRARSSPPCMTPCLLAPGRRFDGCHAHNHHRSYPSTPTLVHANDSSCRWI